LNNNHKNSYGGSFLRAAVFFEGIDKKSGRYLNAPFFTRLTLRQAVEKAEREFDSPYDK
jgi:hypothetical protein